MSEKKLKRHGLHRLHGLGWCKHPRPPWGVTQGDGIIQKMPKVNDSIIQKCQKVNDIASVKSTMKHIATIWHISYDAGGFKKISTTLYA